MAFPGNAFPRKTYYIKFQSVLQVFWRFFVFEANKGEGDALFGE